MTLPAETRRSDKVTSTYVLEMCQKSGQNYPKGYYFEREQIPQIGLTLWKYARGRMGECCAPAGEATLHASCAFPWGSTFPDRPL